jgi:hypothetical protein
MLIPRTKFYKYCQPLDSMLRALTSFSNRQWMLCTKPPELYTSALSNVTAFTYIICALPYPKNRVWKLWCIHNFSEYNYTCYIKAVTTECHVTMGYEYFYLWSPLHQTLGRAGGGDLSLIKFWLMRNFHGKYDWIWLQCSKTESIFAPADSTMWFLEEHWDEELPRQNSARPRLAHSICSSYQWFITVSLPL